MSIEFIFRLIGMVVLAIGGGYLGIFLAIAVNSKPTDPEAKDWEVQPDGSIIFICNSPGPGGFGPIKKITVTPAAGTSVTSWVSSLPK